MTDTVIGQHPDGTPYTDSDVATMHRWLLIDLEGHARRLQECIARCEQAGAVPTDETLRTITACYGETVITVQRERYPETPAVMDYREAFASRPLQPLEVEQRRQHSIHLHGDLPHLQDANGAAAADTETAAEAAAGADPQDGNGAVEAAETDTEAAAGAEQYHADLAGGRLRLWPVDGEQRHQHSIETHAAGAETDTEAAAELPLSLFHAKLAGGGEVLHLRARDLEAAMKEARRLAGAVPVIGIASVAQDDDRNAGAPRVHLPGEAGMTRCEVRYGDGVHVAKDIAAVIGADGTCPLCLDTLEPERRLMAGLHEAIETAREAAMDELQDGRRVTAYAVDAIEAARLAQVAAARALQCLGACLDGSDRRDT